MMAPLLELVEQRVLRAARRQIRTQRGNLREIFVQRYARQCSGFGQASTTEILPGLAL